MTDVCIFPASLKLVNITPVFRKEPKNSKENRPVSILPNRSKIYERCLFKQMPNHFENIFLNFHCGFRQGLSAQYCLMSMTEKWKKSVDKGKLLLPSLPTYPKLLIVSRMTLSLLNVMLIGSLSQPQAQF